jgi:serine/threonine protein kinase
VHGDLKPENVLIFKGTAADYSAKVADFGWSCFERIPGGKVFPPTSKPWVAPEWHHRGFSIENAKRMDIFSLGMLCLWVILQHNVQHLPGVAHDAQFDPWLGLVQREHSTIDLLAEWKNRKALKDLATHSIKHLGGVGAEDKSSLLVFFHRSLQDPSLERESNILRLVDDLDGHG